MKKYFRHYSLKSNLDPYGFIIDITGCDNNKGVISLNDGISAKDKSTELQNSLGWLLKYLLKYNRSNIGDGSSIKVDNEEGEGSTFTVKLPTASRDSRWE